MALDVALRGMFFSCMKKEKQQYVFPLETGSSSEVRALHGLPEESLSDGCSNSGQKEIP